MRRTSHHSTHVPSSNAAQTENAVRAGCGTKHVHQSEWSDNLAGDETDLSVFSSFKVTLPGATFVFALDVTLATPAAGTPSYSTIYLLVLYRHHIYQRVSISVSVFLPSSPTRSVPCGLQVIGLLFQAVSRAGSPNLTASVHLEVVTWRLVSAWAEEVDMPYFDLNTVNASIEEHMAQSVPTGVIWGL